MNRSRLPRQDIALNYSFLIGSQRSGTTWLGSLLGKLDDVAYWEEPRQVWVYRNWHHKDDRLTAADVTPAIEMHIQNRFQSFARQRNANTFIEKTPSNCMRIPFMHRIFPNAKFIWLQRDGRAVLRSTESIRQTGVGWGRLFGRLGESSISEIPAYFDRLGWLGSKLIGRPLKSWGMRPPHWRDWPETLSPLQTISMQWAESMRYTISDWCELPDHLRFVIRYEDLVRNPATELEKLFDFLGRDLSTPNIRAVLETAKAESRTSSIDLWRSDIDEQQLETLRPILEPILDELNYQW